MPRNERRRRWATAAATALVLTAGACGSDGSGGGSEEDTSSSTPSEGADSSAADATGSNQVTVDGTKVAIDDSWRAICARSADGKKGSAVLMEDVSLEQLEADPEAEHGFISVHFDIGGDEADVTTVSITRPPGEQADETGMVSFSNGAAKGTASMTMTEEAVHVEGEGQQLGADGKQRVGIPFTIDVGCTDWQDLTGEGDVQPPG